ncbi:hypothetical protein [Comamonas endophytica]|uniref:Transmembrane protein n=1 Tax=Comamonas endophytica TaxID=2949090 RepID=A0ABY6G9A7_9BURK|nr:MULTISPECIES: hypothetical protein [unclassified Acidovorax]MCD2511927.1 hypothetical protein [Acidovorax sp. D4N7]UYG51644.1 hypothetical protein M9799_16590 [Acidovorax sp. 5MLIR]
MYLVVIAWLYVTLMMAIAEATSPMGSVLGALITFVFYGLLPLSILIYILGTPGRRRRLRVRQQAEQQAWEQARAKAQEASGGIAPDAGGEAPAAAQPGGVAPVREER